ncbi:hypothetical protein ASG25_14085 [Rhizobium sp. Leaf384]|uniref:hypothetical protein n=1 Tax=unclassified Rhizobium TaxID=2613769 RepID=UPI0007138427|nr:MULTISPECIES: hypothetical protein [unclassified Rhizobium]KQR75789.1 hypothetical protein ASG03_19165 [Rhizobium sp. Leaf341]KQS76441.1 hypothetical protein ASG58_11515 [Rhizobium sp. Leaf383]KQS77710.1 hypothetical protein ASG25_14085 [Rhizobium sp. Leaf384]
MYKALILALSVCGSFLSVTAASSADLIVEGGDMNRYAPRAAYVATDVDCERLQIDYRFPYPRYTEIVQVCYPPVDLRPTGVGSTSGGLIHASGRSSIR